MNILITGGCGFIGSHLVDHNIKRGHQVYVVDDLSTGNIANVQSYLQHKNFKLAVADLKNWSGLEDVIKWADCIYHMAAIVGVQRVLDDPVTTIDTNIHACELLFKTMIKLNHKPPTFIASSSMVYGESNKKSLAENDILHVKSLAQGHWIYAVSKLTDEMLACAYHEKYNIPVTILRIFNTIGPRQTGTYGMVVPRFVDAACNGKDITVFGDGLQSRSFCDVRDLVQILELLATNSDCVGEIVNVGNDQEISINDLAALVKKLAKNNSIIRHISYQEAYGHAFEDILHRRPDLQKLHKFINFKHKWSLQDTINDLIKNYHFYN